MGDHGNVPLITGFSRSKNMNPELKYGTIDPHVGTNMPYPSTAYGGGNPGYDMPVTRTNPIGFDDYGGNDLPYSNTPAPNFPIQYPTMENTPVPGIGFEGNGSYASINQPQSTEDIHKRVKTPKRPTSNMRSNRIKDDKRESVGASNSTMFRDGERTIDYVLAYEPHNPDPQRQKNRAEKRESFEKNLKALGLQLEREDVENSCDGKTVFVKIHIPWDFMCRKAEELKMKMPLKEKIEINTFTVFKRVAQSSTEMFVDYDDVIIIMENNIDNRTLSEKLADKICCCNPFELREVDIPEEMNCYTCAFRVDRMDKYIFPENEKDFFSNSQRSRVVHRILMTCRYDDRKHYQMGLARLVSNGAYTAAYPLHAGPYNCEQSSLTHKDYTDRQLLFQHWARPGRWFKEQPLDLIRKYFGEKIGLYFTWLGYYTGMLVPAAIMGVGVIIYGLASMNKYQPIIDLCDKESRFPMCPKCDKKCEYTSLIDSCSYTKATYVLDNPFTILFAIFMSLWATIFLEYWKRKQAEVQYDWDLIGFEDEEEQPRPEFEAAVSTIRLNPITQLEEAYIPNKNVCPRYTVAINCVILMIILVLVAILSVVVYRMAVYAAMATTSTLDIAWVGVIASSTAAIINLIAIMILNKVYEKLALFLTEWEMPKTQTMFDDLFTFKMYLFQFVNFYGSLFYIGFLKLDPGTPEEYNRIFGFRREECNPAGCLFELGLQLCVIMIGKQVFNNFIEILVPKFKNWWRSRDNLIEDTSKLPQWENDYDLLETSQQGLFYEYLEMVIQYGFITIFVAAFPLGPLFALINNLIEIRVDAYKYVAVFRRHYSERVEDIGIWLEILTSVAKISVVVNAFVIGFVSEFVPRIYYEVTSSPDGTLNGFLNSTLSCFDINDFTDDVEPNKPFNFKNGSCGFGKQTCRYRGYYQSPYKWGPNGTILRNENAYSFSPAHWHVIAGKLFFVIAFEHFVFAVVGFIAWAVPDVPSKLSQQIKRENYLAKMAARGESITASSTRLESV